MLGPRFPIRKGLIRPLGETERDFTPINFDGEIFFLFLGLTGLRLDHSRIDGLFGPDNNRALGRSEFPV